MAFAVVSGAHLYGFESPDSDLDLRGMYTLPVQQVVGLRTGPETWNVTKIISGLGGPDGLEVDFVLHDLIKYVRLLQKRSGEILEQLYSPLVVADSPVRVELQHLFEPLISGDFVHHYRGFLHRQRQLLAKEEPPVKQLLYAYRVALTGIHLLKTGRVEANLTHLLADYPQDGVLELIEVKRTSREKMPLTAKELEIHQERLEQLMILLIEAHQNCRLQPEARAQDALHDFVVRLRLS